MSILRLHTLTRGDTKFAAKGTFALSAAHRVNGHFETTSSGLEPVLQHYGIDPSLLSFGALAWQFAQRPFERRAGSGGRRSCICPLNSMTDVSPSVRCARASQWSRSTNSRLVPVAAVATEVRRGDLLAFLDDAAADRPGAREKIEQAIAVAVTDHPLQAPSDPQ